MRPIHRQIMTARLPRLCVALGLCVSAFSRTPIAQEAASDPPLTFRSSVDVVTIQASVRDAHGRVVGGLRPKDFEVRDNGQVRPILSLRADKSPLSLAILVDMSGSMRSKIGFARQAFASVLSQLRQGEDEVAVFSFDSSLHERSDFTRDLTRLTDVLANFEAFGKTSLYDATASAARRLSDRTATRKAIIVLTDGIDTSSSMTAREVSGVASAIDVPVFVVATVPSLDQRMMMEASERSTPSKAADLRDLADWTGGHLIFASTLVETVISTSTLIDELRQQYVLAIEAASGPEWRRLDVRVRRPSTIVKARTGYFAG
jgi:Ca-activated chloride channel family protein